MVAFFAVDIELYPRSGSYSSTKAAIIVNHNVSDDPHMPYDGRCKTFAGDIPPSLGELDSLVGLDLSENELSGELSAMREGLSSPR